MDVGPGLTPCFISPFQDVALVSLANVLYRSGYDIDAANVIHMSLEVGTDPTVNHYKVLLPH